MRAMLQRTVLGIVAICTTLHFSTAKASLSFSGSGIVTNSYYSTIYEFDDQAFTGDTISFSGAIDNGVDASVDVFGFQWDEFASDSGAFFSYNRYGATIDLDLSVSNVIANFTDDFVNSTGNLFISYDSYDFRTYYLDFQVTSFVATGVPEPPVDILVLTGILGCGAVMAVRRKYIMAQMRS
jgi:hypothetical protein